MSDRLPEVVAGLAAVRLVPGWTILKHEPGRELALRFWDPLGAFIALGVAVLWAIVYSWLFGVLGSETRGWSWIWWGILPLPSVGLILIAVRQCAPRVLELDTDRHILRESHWGAIHETPFEQVRAELSIKVAHRDWGLWFEKGRLKSGEACIYEGSVLLYMGGREFTLAEASASTSKGESQETVATRLKPLAGVLEEVLSA